MHRQQTGILSDSHPSSHTEAYELPHEISFGSNQSNDGVICEQCYGGTAPRVSLMYNVAASILVLCMSM